MKTQKSLVYVVLEGELSVMLSVFPFLFLPLHKRSIFPSGVTFKGSLCCVFSLDKVFWVIFSSIHQSFSIPFFFFLNPTKLKILILPIPHYCLELVLEKKIILRFQGQKNLPSHTIFHLWITVTYYRAKGAEMYECNLCHPTGQKLEASIPAAHFYCEFFHLNFALVFTEHNELSANTWNTIKSVIFWKSEDSVMIYCV